MVKDFWLFLLFGLRPHNTQGLHWYWRDLDAFAIVLIGDLSDLPTLYGHLTVIVTSAFVLLVDAVPSVDT